MVAKRVKAPRGAKIGSVFRKRTKDAKGQLRNHHYVTLPDGTGKTSSKEIYIARGGVAYRNARKPATVSVIVKLAKKRVSRMSYGVTGPSIGKKRKVGRPRSVLPSGLSPEQIALVKNAIAISNSVRAERLGKKSSRLPAREVIFDRLSPGFVAQFDPFLQPGYKTPNAPPQISAFDQFNGDFAAFDQQQPPPVINPFQQFVDHNNQ